MSLLGRNHLEDVQAMLLLDLTAVNGPLYGTVKAVSFPATG